MKKINYALLFIAAIFLLLISYQLDEQVSMFFENFRIPFLDLVLGIATNFGILIIITVLIPSIILYEKSKKSFYLLWITFFVSFFLAFIMKLIFLRQRPMPVEAFNYPFINTFIYIINYSFPSMHSMIAFSLLPILIKSLPKQKIFWIVFAFIVGFSRIYFNFHFLSDVVFGAIVGYFTGKKLNWFADSFFSRNLTIHQ